MNRTERNVYAFFGGLIVWILILGFYAVSAEADDHAGMMMPQTNSRAKSDAHSKSNGSIPPW